ncbi:hypothetical protein T4A_6107 [Trichinella pseudospiralis]|uniref:Uncharacterized protein n=1 Tax=Trichinella pseudospiralis TaxID=6337 RepID=A0A0V1EG99_TRIPS|nr:hypothetical protein T4A_6107 [Trichinella pseudospiralis]
MFMILTVAVVSELRLVKIVALDTQTEEQRRNTGIRVRNVDIFGSDGCDQWKAAQWICLQHAI